MTRIHDCPYGKLVDTEESTKLLNIVRVALEEACIGDEGFTDPEQDGAGVLYVFKGQTRFRIEVAEVRP